MSAPSSFDAGDMALLRRLQAFNVTQRAEFEEELRKYEAQRLELLARENREPFHGPPRPPLPIDTSDLERDRAARVTELRVKLADVLRQQTPAWQATVPPDLVKNPKWLARIQERVDAARAALRELDADVE